jgi:hypothetical protein
VFDSVVRHQQSILESHGAVFAGNTLQLVLKRLSINWIQPITD